MKIAIFSENLLGILSSSGGAEVYALKLAECLMKEHDVTVFTLGNKHTENPDNVLQKYNINNRLKVIVLPFVHSKNLLFDIPKRIFLWCKLNKIMTNEYDCFVNTTHNRMLGFRKIKSVHLIHFPVKNYTAVLPKFLGCVMNRAYKKSYRLFLANSLFTQYHIKKEWNCESFVLNPPIDMKPIDSDELNKKEPVLLMVGRIVPDKRIKEIVDFFESVKDFPKLQKYKLIIAGNKDSKNEEFYEYLKFKEKQGRIVICSNLSYQELVRIYRRSLIFIHAKGFLESDENPMQMEHFGMTTVEAMANGCIPLVINKAGQKEIVEQGISGYLWNDLRELRTFLLDTISDSEKIYNLQIHAIEKSKKYLINSFSENTLKIFSNL